jgi:hypothetical protein
MTITTYLLLDSDTKCEIATVVAASAVEARDVYARECQHPSWASLLRVHPNLESEIEIRAMAD